MKNKIKLLIILLSCFLFLGNVKAYDEKTKFTSKSVGTVGDAIKYGPGTASAYDARIYKVSDGTEEYYAYCLDPGINAGNKLKVDHILMYSNSTTPAQDYGILTILSKGEPGSYDRMVSANGVALPDPADEEYEATMIALRMFVNGIAGWRYIYDGNTYLPSLLKTLYEWVRDDAEFAKLYEEYNTAAPQPEYILSRNMFNYKAVKDYQFGIKTSVANRAKVLVKEGLKATVSYMKGEVVNPTVDVTIKGTTDVETTGNSLTRMVVVAFTPKNFGVNGGNGQRVSYVTYDGIENTSQSNVEYIGFSTKYSFSASDYNNSAADKMNVLDYLKEQNTDTLYIAYRVTISTNNVNAEGCSSTFSVNYSYNDTGLLNGAILLPADDAGSDFSNLQRFAMYSHEGATKSFKVNAHVCDSYCSPDVEMPQICEDGTAADSSGHVTYSYKEGSKNGADNINSCIIGGKDSANNSYQLLDNKYASAVENNPYCAVYCKENFNFHMPYKIDNVASGRYFQIGMSIDAQEDCYLSKLNRDKFASDIKSVQESAVAAYNEYARNKAIASAKPVKVVNGCKKPGDKLEQISDERSGNDRVVTWNVVDNIWQITIPSYDICTTYSSGSEGQVRVSCTKSAPQTLYFYTKTEKKETTEGYYIPKDTNTNTNSNNNSVTKPNDKKLDRVMGNTGSSYVITPTTKLLEPGLDGPNYSNKVKRKPKSSSGGLTAGPTLDTTNSCQETDDISNITALINNNGIVAEIALSRFEDSEYAIASIVDELNSCIYGWDLVYDFNPDVRYSYDEPEPGNASVTKWIEAVKNIGADKMITTSKEVYSSKCAEGTSEYCHEVDQFTSIDGEAIESTRYCSGLSNAQSYECSDRFANAEAHFHSNGYTFCTESGCTTASYSITSANYVHKIATAKVELDTSRVYYSLHDRGQVIVRETKPTDVNADVVDGLPVAASTPQGTYFYTISLANIGNYYSTGEAGRIFSKDTTSLSNYVRTSNITTINNDIVAQNEYACIYEVSQNTCKDGNGVTHNLDTECIFGEDKETCKQRVCPDKPANTCTYNGVTHDLNIECNADESQAACQNRLCPSGEKNYCVKGASGYYVCETQSLNSSCVKKNSREEAISEAKENYNCCPQCTVVCIGTCLYNFDKTKNVGKLLVDFRTITPANLNPNNRKLGYNWDVENKSNPLVANKAKNTISEIETRANVDVENVSSANVKEIKDYAFKVKMTTSLANWVKNYNNTVEDQGSYGNNTLECYDYTLQDYDEKACKSAGYTWENNSCKMTNIFCYSTFIDELIEKFPDKVDAKNRQTAKDDARSNYKEYQNLTLPSQDTKIVTNDYWSIYLYTNLDTNGDGIPDIGPSWK